MLLLASVVFGGSGADEAFEFLPEEEAELLKHRSGAFRAIPKEQRIPFLVREMRRMLSMRRRRLATADPEHLAGLLAKEKPVVSEVILRALPSMLAHSVQAALPGFKATPLRKEPRAEVFSIVRWKLEEELQNSSVSTFFQFADLIGLQARELITICDRMGARVFATALMGLPIGERQSFLGGLPPDQRMLAQKACDATKTRHLQANDARRLLELYNAAADASTALRSAGARRVMRACFAESADFASKMARRHEGELGKLLSRWFDEEKSRQIQGDGGKADILEQLEFLAKRGFLERPLILSKPKAVPVAQNAKVPETAKPASNMGVGSTRLAAPPSMKPSRLLPEKLPKPTLSKIVGPKEPVAAASRVSQSPKPQTMERSASTPPGARSAERVASLRPEATNAQRPASPPPGVRSVERSASLRPGATNAQRPASPPPGARSAERSASFRPSAQRPVSPPPKTMSQDMPTGKASFSQASTPDSTPTPVNSPGKGAVIRMPALQSVPRRRVTETEAAKQEKTDHGLKSAKAKPEDKG